MFARQTTPTTNKRLQKESTAQTWCLRSEAHRQEINLCKKMMGADRRERHFTNPVFARCSTHNLHLQQYKRANLSEETEEKALHRRGIFMANMTHKLGTRGRKIQASKWLKQINTRRFFTR